MDGHIAAGELLPRAHWSSASPLFYYEMPGDLHAELARMDLVIVKGDANYRRLLGDAHWPHETPFADVVSYFPAPVVALRTFKSEVAVGLAPGQAEELAACGSAMARERPPRDHTGALVSRLKRPGVSHA